MEVPLLLFFCSVHHFSRLDVSMDGCQLYSLATETMAGAEDLLQFSSTLLSPVPRHKLFFHQRGCSQSPASVRPCNTLHTLLSHRRTSHPFSVKTIKSHSVWCQSWSLSKRSSTFSSPPPPVSSLVFLTNIKCQGNINFISTWLRNSWQKLVIVEKQEQRDFSIEKNLQED